MSAPDPQLRTARFGTDTAELQLQPMAPSGPTASSDQDQLILMESAVTRVMSPNPNLGLLLGIHAACGRCGHNVYEPSICAQCSTYGHPVCLNLEYFQGYPFCGTCMAGVAHKYAEFQDALSREQFMRSLSGQINTWRARATEALGLSASVGVALGGAAATATGAAIAMVQGVVKGARTGGSSSPQPLALTGDPSVGQPFDDSQAVPSAAAPPLPEPASLLQPKRAARPLTRSRSSEALCTTYSTCVACHTPNKGHRPHTYQGDCIGIGFAYMQKMQREHKEWKEKRVKKRKRTQRQCRQFPTAQFPVHLTRLAAH